MATPLIPGSIPNKRYLTVYKPSTSNPLNLRQLLVLSYYLFQDRYDTIPTYAVCAAATGLDPETVSSAAAELRRRELFAADNKPTLTDVQMGWFLKLKTGKDQHPSRRLAWWRFYIRKPTGPLTVSAVGVWSFLWHVSHNPAPGREPDWSVAFISTCLHLKPETVEKSLSLLQDFGFLSWSPSPFVLRLKTLGTDQLDYLDDAPIAMAKRRPKGLLMLEDDGCDSRATVESVPDEPTHVCVVLINEVLEQAGIDAFSQKNYTFHAHDDMERFKRMTTADDYRTAILEGMRAWQSTDKYKQFIANLNKRHGAAIPRWAVSSGPNGQSA